VKSPSQRARILPGTRGTFVGFRDSITRSASRCTRELPGGLRLRHSGTGGTLRRWVRKGVSGWHVPKEAFGLAFGTSVILRRFPKGCFDGASKGSSGRALRRLRKGFRDTRRSPKGFERGCSDVARPEGGSRKGLREGCCGLAIEGVFRRSLVPKGVFEGGFEEGLPRGCFGEFPRGCLRRRLRRGLSEGFREVLPWRAAMIVGSKMGG